MPINPYVMQGTRFQTMGRLYEQWYPLELRFQWVSTTAYTTSGAAYLGFDHDVTDYAATDEVTNIATMADNLIVKGTDSGSFTVKFSPNENMLFTDNTEDMRLGSAGALHARFDTGVTGYILLHWKVRMFHPQIESSMVPIAVDDISVSAATSPSGHILDNTIADTSYAVQSTPALTTSRRYYGLTTSPANFAISDNGTGLPSGTPVIFEPAQFSINAGAISSITTATTNLISKMMTLDGTPVSTVAGSVGSMLLRSVLQLPL
jgi:hypothetical protein